MTIAKTAQAKYIGKTRQMKLRLEAFSRLPLAAPPPLPFTEWNSRSGTLPKLEVGADSFVSPISNISLRYEMFLQYISEDMHGDELEEVSDSSDIGKGDNKVDIAYGKDQDDPGKGKLKENEGDEEETVTEDSTTEETA